ncbi:MAG: DUF402 domain-containing protein [Oscillospiraceae bacterium]|nr:DUF402 domain-containing protein [Oscillospiraceae bacterium]
MKRKRLDRDKWYFDGYPYYQMRVGIEEFHGLVCLIQLGGEDGKYQHWPFPKAGQAAVCGKGMTWLQLIPDGEKHVITAMYMPDNLNIFSRFFLCHQLNKAKRDFWRQWRRRKAIQTDCRSLLSVWYVDVIENIEYDTDGVAVFVDKYLDVIFTPQGDMGIDDRDELDEALQSGDITKEQYEAALKECDLIIDELCSDAEKIRKTEVLCDKILSYVNERIKKGEKPFK